MLCDRPGFDRPAAILEASTFTYETHTGEPHPHALPIPNAFGVANADAPWIANLVQCIVMCVGPPKSGYLNLAKYP